jgi:hypothetical protein
MLHTQTLVRNTLYEETGMSMPDRCYDPVIVLPLLLDLL